MDSPTLFMQNAAGEQFPAMAETTVTDGLNEDKTLSLNLIENETNAAFLGQLDETWYVGGVSGPADQSLWKITIARRRTTGHLRTMSVQARLKFIDDMDNDRIYERYDRSLTAARFFTLLFDGTPYTYQFQGSFAAQSWEGLFDGESRLESFQRGLERYDMEYELVGDQVHLHPLIERTQPYIMHRKLNASNIEQEVDASEFWTYARGFGDYEGEADSGENGGVTERANLIREYESPLAKIVGRRHAPPVKNGNITQTATMDEALKNLVEQSINISITSDFHVLTDYPYAKPENGDVITVIDDVLQYEAQTRVVKIETVRDAAGKIKSQKVTNGGQNISERQKAQLNAAGNFISDLQKGRRTIPFNFQDGASKLATNLLLAARTEVDFTTQGLILTDKSNPNLVVLVNSAGIGISQDGGQTFRNALTGAGLVADVVTSGTLNTHLARIAGTDGVFVIDGDELLSVDLDDPDKYVRISPGHAYFTKGGVSFERPDGYVVFENGIATADYEVQNQLSPPLDPSVVNDTIVRGASEWFVNTTSKQHIGYLGFKHTARYLNVQVSQRTRYSQTANVITVESVSGGGGVLAEHRSTNISEAYDQAQSIITVDLGVPDGGQRNVHLYTRGTSDNTVYTSILRAWLSG